MQNGDSIEAPPRSLTITGFLSNLRNARSRALLLDYDGTLAPFTCNPAQALPYPEIPDTLRRIQRETDTRLVIVTGRGASDIPRLLGLSDVEIWGCHGLERLRPDGSNEIARVDPRQVGYPQDRSITFYEELQRKLTALPSVESVAMSFSVPMGYIFDVCQVRRAGEVGDQRLHPRAREEHGRVPDQRGAGDLRVAAGDVEVDVGTPEV